MSPFRCLVCDRPGRTAMPPLDCPTRQRCEFVYLEEQPTEAHPVDPAILPQTSAASPVPAAVDDADGTGSPPPAETPEVASGVPILLVFRDQQRTLERPTVLGRNGDLMVEMFRSFPQVARRHCELLPVNRDWWLINLSERSPTRVNGTLLEANARQKLASGRHDVLLGEAMHLALTIQEHAALQENVPNPLADFRKRRSASHAAGRVLNS